MDRKPRRGVSLLELIVTAALMATLVTGVSLVLRSGQSVWLAQQSDYARWDSAHATLRHLTRHLRQAEQVVAISDPANTSGNLQVVMPNAETWVWEHSGDQVLFGVGSATDLLANGISQLQFTGYQADGITTTTIPGETQSIYCTVTIQLPRETNPERTVSTWIWLRTATGI